MTVSELARRAGVTVDTVRHYTRSGLLVPVGTEIINSAVRQGGRYSLPCTSFVGLKWGFGFLQDMKI